VEQQATVRQRRTMPAEVGRMLAEARMRAGLRGNEAARLLGLSAGYLVDLHDLGNGPHLSVATTIGFVPTA